MSRVENSRLLLAASFTLLISVTLSADELPGSNAAPETLAAVLAFKDINVFEYDLDLIFINKDSSEIWFAQIDPSIADAGLYTAAYDDGFPAYTLVDSMVGKKFLVLYLEIQVEGEFSGELEHVKKITGLQEPPP